MDHRSNEPTHCYSIAFCVHLIAYALCTIAAFTPYWSEVKEEDGSNAEIKYDKGPILSCDVPGGPSDYCGLTKDIAGSSGELIATFILVIAYLLLGFFIFQTLIVGVCVRSLRQRNLGIILVVQFMIQVVILILCIVIFDASVKRDTITGNTYKDHSFGLSRYMLATSAVLFFFCACFATAEYLKRQATNTVQQDLDNKSYITMHSIAGSQASGKTRTHSYYHQQASNNRTNNNSVINNSSSNNDRRISNDSGGLPKGRNNKFVRRPSDNHQILSPFDFKQNTSNNYASSSVVPLQGHTYRRF